MSNLTMRINSGKNKFDINPPRPEKTPLQEKSLRNFEFLTLNFTSFENLNLNSDYLTSKFVNIYVIRMLSISLFGEHFKEIIQNLFTAFFLKIDYLHT